MKQLYHRFFTALCICCLLLTPVMAGDKDLSWNDVYCFTEADLTSGDGVNGVYISAVPGDALGRVKLGSRTIQAGDVLTKDDLSALSFLPTQGAQGEAVISCIGISDAGLGEETQMTFRIGSGKNEAPTAEDQEIETYKNVPVEIPLKASDPEGDTLTVNIVKEPKRGTLQVNDTGTVTYTPEENKVGKDAFVYTVTDTAGNTSPEATVAIKIEKPHHKETYADMTGDPALRSATWLREMEVYCGETVSGHLLFQPEEAVTRGEFIAMCMALDNDREFETISTGFADEDTLPTWLSPYVAEAVKCGYLSGIPTESGLSMLAQQDITRGEAAVIVSDMLSLPKTDSQTVMATDAQVPVWAQASVGAALETGVFDATDSQAVLTRREAAELLYDAWHMASENAGDNTLLSWAKE